MAIAGIPNPGVCAYPPERVRRRYARRAVEGIALELGDAAAACVLNLSEGGARVKAPGPLALARGALISLSLPGGNAIQANCELVWTEDTGDAGLRFLAFSDNGKKRLAKWLSDSSAEAVVRSEQPPLAATAVVEHTLPPKPAPAADPDWSADASEAGLEELVRKMMVMTAAEGAAIALRRADGIVCCATAGNAPRLGVRLNPESGLSGRCLRSGEPVLCRDSETDPTVNAEACRALRLRAALLVPVKRDGSVGGVLEVFSSKPDVFDLGDIAALQRISLLAAEYLPELSAPPVAVAPEAPSEAETSAAPAPAANSSESAEAPAEIEARPSVVRPDGIFRLIEDPQYKPWKRVVYWSVIVLRKAISLVTLTVPLAYLMCFLVGPVIRPGVMLRSGIFGYLNAVVEPGMALADDFFSFRGVVNGWNLMFLLVGGIALIGRAMALKPINLLLRKAEEMTRPRKRYGYVPYLPHRTDFR